MPLPLSSSILCADQPEILAIAKRGTWSAWNEGRDTLELAGEDFMDVGIRDYDIWEE